VVAQKKYTFRGTPAPHTALWGGADLIRHITQNAEVIGEFSKFNRLNIECRSLFRHDRSHRLLLRSFTSYFFFLHRGKRIRRELNKIFFIRMLPTLMTLMLSPRPCDSGPFASGFLNVFKFSTLRLYEVLRKLSAIKNSRHTF